MREKILIEINKRCAGNLERARLVSNSSVVSEHLAERRNYFSRVPPPGYLIFDSRNFTSLKIPQLAYIVDLCKERLKYLSLRDNKFEVIGLLTDVLLGCSALENFDLSGNPLNAIGIAHVANLIGGSGSLRTLVLARLRGAGFNREAEINLVRGLAENQSLCTLDLSGNTALASGLSDQLCKAIREHPCLNKLVLNGINFTIEGLEQLKKLVTKSVQLCSLDLDTCPAELRSICDQKRG